MDNRFTGIHWDRLLKRLTACAASWFLKEDCLHEEDILPATGKSAVELARDAALAFFKGEIKWNQSTGEEGLYSVIRVAMRHDFLDLVKAGRAYKRTDVLDIFESKDGVTGENKNSPVLEHLADPVDKGFYSQEVAFISAQIYPLIENDIELKDFIDAVLDCGYTKREDIAAVLGISPQEFTNRQRRLRLKLASWHRHVHASRKSIGH